MVDYKKKKKITRYYTRASRYLHYSFSPWHAPCITWMSYSLGNDLARGSFFFFSTHFAIYLQYSARTGNQYIYASVCIIHCTIYNPVWWPHSRSFWRLKSHFLLMCVELVARLVFLTKRLLFDFLWWYTLDRCVLCLLTF